MDYDLKNLQGEIDKQRAELSKVKDLLPKFEAAIEAQNQ